MDNTASLARAIAYHQAGNLNEADRLCRTLLVAEPRNATAITLLGTIQLQRGNLDDATRLFEFSLDIDPHQPHAQYCLGIAQSAMNRPNDALASYDRAISLAPDLVQAYNNRGLVLEQLSRPEDALISYERAIAINPSHANAHSNRGNILNQLGRYDEALASHERAVAINPNNANTYYNRGIALSNLKRHDEALASYSHAIVLDPSYAKAYNNRGLTLARLKRYEEALANFSQSIALNPHLAETHNNQGNTLRDIGQYELALSSYDQAIALNHDNADVHLNKAYVHILLGNYTEGWRLHEWRWNHHDRNKMPKNFPKPLWLGQDNLKGKTILLHAEQGLGDSIQFSRYAPMVEALGADVVLEVPQILATLLSSLSCAIRVIPEGEPLPNFEFHCPLMSLPFAFKTTVDTIPALSPYLWIDEDRKSQWQQLIGAKTKPCIGLAWSGNPQHTNDHNRSIPLELLTQLLDLDFDFHCLQKDIRPEDHESLVKYRKIRQHGVYLKDFSDTAALTSEMDLIISVDTSVAHLAGALGKRVWILLPYSPDHRWMANRNDSPWYPTARLFRQPQLGDWASVIENIAVELAQYFDTSKHCNF